ncbi:hypothetical protein FKP32DRAFT_1222366 [Trametes sanguinea]|nr:hypothetical protein FKP32DRAFT_1222366 [Trametes sanguinea]
MHAARPLETQALSVPLLETDCRAHATEVVCQIAVRAESVRRASRWQMEVACCGKDTCDTRVATAARWDSPCSWQTRIYLGNGRADMRGGVDETGEHWQPTVCITADQRRRFNAERRREGQIAETCRARRRQTRGLERVQQSPRSQSLDLLRSRGVGCSVDALRCGGSALEGCSRGTLEV